MSVNVNKLRGILVEKNIKICELADLIGISKSTLHRKLKSNGISFTVEEVENIVTYLALSPEEALNIFFSDWVALLRQNNVRR